MSAIAYAIQTIAETGDNTVSSPYLCRPFEHGAGIEPIDDLLADLEQALAAV